MTDLRRGHSITVKFEGDTSGWDAKEQLRAAKAVIRLLEAIDVELHGEKTVKWRIIRMGMEKDD